MLRPAGADRSDLRPGADRGGSMTATTPTVQEQASAVLVHAAGYASPRTIAIGLRSGLLEALAASEHTTPEELAERLGMDPFYVSVWCRAAYAAGICDRDAGRYRLAAHMATLLLCAPSPASPGGLSPSWSNTRCSAASRPASPPASGSGGARPAPTGSPGSPAPAPPSTPALSPAGFSRSRGCPNGWRPAPRSSTAHAAPGSGWSVWPPTIPLAGSSGATGAGAQSSRRASASPRAGWRPGQPCPQPAGGVAPGGAGGAGGQQHLDARVPRHRPV